MTYDMDNANASTISYNLYIIYRYEHEATFFNALPFSDGQLSILNFVDIAIYRNVVLASLSDK